VKCMKRTGPTNPIIQDLINEIKKVYVKDKVPFYKALLKQLSKPSRARAQVNIGKLDLLADKDLILVVPGKVLSVGEITKSFKVAALSFSQNALEKLNASKIEIMYLEDLIKKAPKAKGVKLVI
jgi:large subunit ribosomal protein L18e